MRGIGEHPMCANSLNYGLEAACTSYTNDQNACICLSAQRQEPSFKREKVLDLPEVNDMPNNRNAWTSRLSSTCMLAIPLLLITLPAISHGQRSASELFNVPAASGEVRAKAEQGHLQQQLTLAADYFLGRGVSRDLSESARWYRKAADQGDPTAQVELGYFYRAGIGVQRNDAEAARWYQRAAASGSARGKLNLAVMYLNGAGVHQDTQEAIRLLRGAAKGEEGAAEAYLGVMSYFGIGMPADRSAAENWFRSGVKHHSPEAEFDLGSLYSINPDHVHDMSKAAGLLRQSAAQSYVPAEHSLGLLLIQHPDLRQKPGEAIRMLSSAAESGSWRSSVMLGVLARDGTLTLKDPKAAYRWFRVAALQGEDEARAFLDRETETAALTVPADERKAVEDEALAWFQAHPHNDIYHFDTEASKKFFPMQEIQATLRTEKSEPPRVSAENRN